MAASRAGASLGTNAWRQARCRYLQRALGDARRGKVGEHARQPGLHGVDKGGIAGQHALRWRLRGWRLRPRSMQGLEARPGCAFAGLTVKGSKEPVLGSVCFRWPRLQQRTGC